MAKMKFTSKADLRWAERYRRICEIKEAEADYRETKRKERAERKTASALNLSVLIGAEKTAVYCETTSEIRALLKAVSEQFPEKLPNFRVDLCLLPGIAFDLKLDDNEPIDLKWPWIYEQRGYRIVGISDLKPVRDLGNLYCDADLDILFT